RWLFTLTKQRGPAEIYTTPRDVTGATVLAAERHQFILNKLAQKTYVSSDEIAQDLGVSLETVRRDLSALESRGHLSRVRGGASDPAAISGEEPPFSDRADLSREAKAKMARIAVSLVKPGMTLMIDVGTTCLEVARQLPVEFRGRVVTCSLLVAFELAERRNIEVLVSGGRLRGGDMSLANATTLRFFEDVHPDIAFLGSGGIDAQAGLTDYHADEVATRQLVLRKSARSYVLADHAKHSHIAPLRVAGIEDFTGLIADELDDQPLINAMSMASTQILTQPAVD
ncbi:DeoR/GlpR family DNA-binding transcription regulator, partial [Leifsonia kafniensis]|uniref:DeoR/GlpR family DNA-binding transcription regulator n=1 Tax=Leifsonia kafniensis TaxID=475957 RepID=UPI0031EF6D9B